MGFFKKVKRFFIFLIFLLLLASSLVFFSLSEEESYKDACQEFGLKCSQGKMHDSVVDLKAWFADLIKKAETLEIWQYFDKETEGSSRQ